MIKINKKILVVAENLEVNRTSSGLRSNKQILLYQKYFANVEVLTTTPLSQFKQLDDVSYVYIDASTIKKSILSRIPKVRAIPAFLNGFSLENMKLIKLWSEQINQILSNDFKDLVVVLATGISHLVSIAMLNVDKQNYDKYLQFVHDPYPLSLYPDPYRINKSIKEKIFIRKFKKVLEKADIISYPALNLQYWMQDFYGEKFCTKSIVQHHIGLQKHELETIFTREEVLDRIVLKEGLNITHTGTLIGHRDPRFLFEAFEQFIQAYPEARKEVYLNVIGKVTNYWSDLKVSCLNINVIKERVSYSESLDIQKASDVLFTLEPVADTSPIMHGKMADYFTYNKPIMAITSLKSENARLLGYDYPLTIINGDTNSIFKVLELIYSKYKSNELQSLNVPLSKREVVFPNAWLNNLRTILAW
jgi:hypothetical protein